MSDSVDNCAGIQTLIDNQYALLQNEQALYADLQAQRGLLGYTATSSDPASISDGGEGGSEAVSLATLTQQLTESAQRMKSLQDGLKELFREKNMRFPWEHTDRRRRFGGFCP